MAPLVAVCSVNINPQCQYLLISYLVPHSFAASLAKCWPHRVSVRLKILSAKFPQASPSFFCSSQQVALSSSSLTGKEVPFPSLWALVSRSRLNLKKGDFYLSQSPSPQSIGEKASKHCLSCRCGGGCWALFVQLKGELNSHTHWQLQKPSTDEVTSLCFTPLCLDD